jgi:hypothetical protein
MTQIHLLSNEERRLFFNEASIESKISFEIIEKDFWVVWTLEKLFSLDVLKSHLTFKGGTSLSKVYRVIERFSEDIDVSIEKNFFGFDSERDPEKATSKKKQTAALKALGHACSKYVQNELVEILKSAIKESLHLTEGWSLHIDPDDFDGQTLLFEYPNLTPRGSYIQQSVKIEIGARSEHWPTSKSQIQSYVKDALKDKVTESPVNLRVLDIERTFWEKATILHQYAHLPEGKTMPPRISRHYYDFFCLLKHDKKNSMAANHKLLERVVKHKSIYFASAWARYDSACRGTLKLSPGPGITKLLEDDFKSMTSMIFGINYDWQLILKTIKNFETEFNGIDAY